MYTVRGMENQKCKPKFILLSCMESQLVPRYFQENSPLPLPTTLKQMYLSSYFIEILCFLYILNIALHQTAKGVKIIPSTMQQIGKLGRVELYRTFFFLKGKLLSLQGKAYLFITKPNCKLMDDENIVSEAIV